MADSSPDDHEIHPVALAKALATMASHLSAALPAIADEGTRGLLERSLGGMRSVCKSLESIEVLYDPEQARQFARHGEGLKRLALRMAEVVGDLTAAARHVATRLDDHILELERIAAMPPGDGVTARLEVTVAHVRKMAAEMNEMFDGISSKASSAADGISALVGELRAARERAFIDALTRVHTRAALDQRLAEAVGEGEAHGPWSLLLIDIDNFRQVSEAHGPIVGDALLFRIARAIEDTAPQEEERCFVARYGGEEFAILLAQADAAEAARVAEAVRSTVAAARWQRRGTPGKPIVQVTTSIGVTQYRGSDTAAGLLGRAEAALRQAKAQGGNRVVAG